LTERRWTTLLHRAVTLTMWAVVASAFLGAFLPFLTRMPILIMFCDRCSSAPEVAALLVEGGGLSILIILVAGGAALGIWHATRWPYVILGPLLLAGTIAGAGPGTLYDWFWWLSARQGP